MESKKESKIAKNLEWQAFRSVEEVRQLVKSTGRQLIVRHGGVYDVQEFLEVYKHPGGSKIIEREFGQDVGEVMIKYEHSTNAYSLLELYKVGFIEGVAGSETLDDRATNERLTTLGIDPKHLTSAMAKFDLSRGLVHQIYSLDLSFEEYMAFIHDPKLSTKSVRLFESDFLEFFSKTNWYFVPMFWLPVMLL